MTDKKNVDYKSIVPRSTAIATCVFGLLELLVATSVLVCAFVMFGGFCDKLSCDELSSGIGFWLGFPLLLPAISGIVVMGTRHRMSVRAFGLLNFLVLALSVGHLVVVYWEDRDIWSLYKTYYDTGKCSLDWPLKCRCIDGGTNLLLPYDCELISFGSDLNWVLFGLSCASAVLCLCGVITSVVGQTQISVTPRKS